MRLCPHCDRDQNWLVQVETAGNLPLEVDGEKTDLWWRVYMCEACGEYTTEIKKEVKEFKGDVRKMDNRQLKKKVGDVL